MTSLQRTKTFGDGTGMLPSQIELEIENITNGFNNHDQGLQYGKKQVSLLNVRWFGAKGDGATDDTAAIQAAITAAESSYGDGVYFPRGTYALYDQLRIKRTVSLIAMAGTVLADSDYTTDAGWPVDTGGVIIKQFTAAKRALYVQQETIGGYSMILRIENIMFLGPATGAAGNGVEIDSGSTGFPIRCIFKNVNVSYFMGYGLNLVEGYFGSFFENIDCGGNGYTGFHAIGTSQGEYVLTNLRSFGNGGSGTTDEQKCGLYINSGGSGITLTRISCTTNKSINAYLKGTSFILTDYQAESFITHNSSSRSIVFENCSPIVNGCAFGTPTGFLGKTIELKNVDRGIFNGLNFYDSVDPSAYQIYEDSSCTNNMYNYTTISGTFIKNFNDTSSFAGLGSELYKKGTSTNDSPPALWIGERQTASVAAASAVSSTGTGNYFDITSLSLTAGDWEVSGMIAFLNNGATTSYTSGGISTTSGNSGTGLVNGVNASEGPPSNNAYAHCITIPGCEFKLSATTTLYLKSNIGFSAGTPKAFGSISARRMR